MKQMEITKKEIGENTFYIKPFPAFVAVNISGELVSVLSPCWAVLLPWWAPDLAERVPTKSPRTSWTWMWKTPFRLSHLLFPASGRQV